MKSKVVTYILIIVVAVVWGIIIYRIFSAATDDADIPVPQQSAIQKIKVEDYSEAKDTTHLMLNYPDPFVKEMAPTIKESGLHIDKPIKVQNVIKPIINWSFINYSGFIKNNKSKKTLTLLTVNGKQYTLGDGETADNVRLVKNMIDSIKILYHGASKFIVLNNK